MNRQYGMRTGLHGMGISKGEMEISIFGGQQALVLLVHCRRQVT